MVLHVFSQDLNEKMYELWQHLIEKFVRYGILTTSPQQSILQNSFRPVPTLDEL
jgi:hypothetical protein